MCLLVVDGLNRNGPVALMVYRRVPRHVKKHRCLVHVSNLRKFVNIILWKESTFFTTSEGSFCAICVLVLIAGS